MCIGVEIGFSPASRVLLGYTELAADDRALQLEEAIVGEPRMADNRVLQHCSFTAIGARQQNQDRFLALEDRTRSAYLFAVADGMGGHRSGAEAAEACMAAIRQDWAGTDSPVAVADRIQRIIRRCHFLVQRLATTDEYSPPQTTLAVLIVTPTETWSGHVGDTRVIHYSSSGLVARTRDHSVTEMKLVSGRITEEEAMHDPDLNLLTQALGSQESPEATLKQWRLQEGDLMCLASDGAWSLLTDADFRSLTLSRQLQPATDELLGRRLAQAPAGQDNATVVLVQS